MDEPQPWNPCAVVDALSDPAAQSVDAAWLAKTPHLRPPHVSLWSRHHGRWLAAWQQSSSRLLLSASRCDRAADFQLFPHGDKFALKTYTGAFVSVRQDGSLDRAKSVGAWELLDVQPSHAGDGSVVLRTAHGGRLLSAQNDGSFQLRDEEGEWERFHVVLNF
jgi:hypothetical protein